MTSAASFPARLPYLDRRHDRLVGRLRRLAVYKIDAGGEVVRLKRDRLQPLKRCQPML